jgi:N-acetylneuraminate lyase
MSERKLTAERWIQASAGRLTVMVHVGTPCMKDVKELASHAESAGADAIATIPPVFHTPVTISESQSQSLLQLLIITNFNLIGNLVTFLKEVSMSAPTLPLFLYHIPAFTHVDCKLQIV